MSLGHIPCERSRGHISCLIDMKTCQNVGLYEILNGFNLGQLGLGTRSLGQIEYAEILEWYSRHKHDLYSKEIFHSNTREKSGQDLYVFVMLQREHMLQ